MKKSFGIFIFLVIILVGVLGGVSAASGVTITYPNGGENLHNDVPVTWTLNGAGTGLLTLQYSSNGGSTWNDLTTLAPGSTGYTWSTTAKSGGDGSNYRIYIIESGTNVYDLSDNVFTIDNTNPSSQVSLGDYQNTATFSVPYTASDSPSGVKYVELYYKKDGGAWTKYETTFSSSPISFNSATTGGDGVYGFYTIATDNSLNVESFSGSADDSTRVDIVAPTTSDDYGAKDNVWQKVDQTITLTPDDASPSSGFEWTKYCLTNGCDPSTGTPYAGGAIPISTGGTTYFRYASKDNAGNVQVTQEKIVKIDKVNPTATLSPSSLSSITVTKTALTINSGCSDSLSGCLESKLYISTTPIVSCSVSYTDYILSSPQSITDRSYICVAAKDVAGNINYSSPVEFKIFSTIQSAIDAASTGDTINVGAGTYDEQVVINKALTLQGAGDTTIIKPSSAAKLTQHLGISWAGGTKEVAGIVIVNEVVGGDVTIKNLKIDGENIATIPSGANWVTGILYRESGGIIDDVSAEDMIIVPLDWVRGYGFVLYSATNPVSVEVKNSDVVNYDKNGINAQGNKLTANIHHNTITGRGPLPEGDEVQNGILVIDNAVGTVDYNTVSNNAYTPATWGATGIAFINAGGSATGNILTNNQMGAVAQTLTGFGSGTSWTVSFLENTASAPILNIPGISGLNAATYVTGTTLTIIMNGNQLTGGLGDGISIGDIEGLGAAGVVVVTVTNNDVSNWQNGIHIIGSITSGNSINHNKIYSNSQYGVKNEVIGVTINAKNNWWGTNVGSTIATKISGNVDYTPWAYALGQYDSTNPIIGTLTISPKSGNYISGTSAISASVSDSPSGIASCEYTLDETTWNVGTVNSGACVLTGINTATATLINIRATDNSGNVGTGSTVAVTPDTTAPTITINNPGTSPAQSKTITASTSDGTLTMFVNAAGVTTCEGGLAFTSYDSTTFSLESDNTRTVCYKAEDSVGNIRYSSSAIAGIDKTAPTITINNPGTSPAQSKTITASTSDGTLTMFVNAAGVTTCDGTLTFGAYSSTTFTSQSENTKTVCYRSADVAGNIAYLISAAIAGIDNTAPTVVLTKDHSDNLVRDADTVIITATFTEANGLSGTPTLTIGTLISSVGMTSTANPLVWTYSWNVPSGSDGAQSISVSSTDVAGNSNSAATGVTSLTIDNIAPVISNLVPLGGNKTISVGQTVTFTLTATDANGVADVKLYNETGSLTGSFAHTGGNSWSYTSATYNTKGNYKYYIKATDSVSNEKREPTTTYTITVNDLIWDLSSKWNLVSVPKTLTTNSVSTLLSGSEIWQYSSSGSWVIPTTLTPGVGYWIDSHNPILGLNYATQTNNQTLPSETIILYQGWNLIGHMCQNTQNVGVAFPTSIYNNLFVLRYNEVTDAFEIYATQDTGTRQFTQMVTGEGYWVFVPSGNLAYTNICN